MATRNEEEAPHRSATRRGTGSRSEDAREAPRREAPRRDSSGSDGTSGTQRERPARKRPPAEGNGSGGSEITSVQAAQRAVVQLHKLTTREIEAVVGMSKKDDGNWSVVVEVVEAHHFPDTSDVMAEYSVDVDTQGELVGYSRGQRYLRGRPGAQ